MTKTSANVERPLVLIVDDDVTVRILARESLEQAGLRVEEAEDGAQALSAFKRLRPDIVLLDIVLPQVGGFSVCEEIRKIPGGDQTPILMVTGVDDIESINQAYGVGATDFAVKPLNWVILGHRVRYMLRASWAADELRKSKARLAKAQHIAHLGNWDWDIEHDELTWSDEMYRIFGLRVGEFQNTLEAFLIFVHPDDREFVRQFVNAALNRTKPFSIDYRIALVDGTVKTVHQEVDVTFDETGKAVWMTGTVQDITQFKRAEEEKRGFEAQLQRAEKMETVGTLAAGVAHDLNNILSGLVSYPELLLLDLPENSPLRNPILTIQNSGKKAAAVVQDLLTLARRGVAITEVLNLNDIITDYLGSPECERLKEFHPGVQVVTSLETDLLNVLGSPVHLSKTVMNLFSNAAEALPDGGKVFISTKNQYIDRPIRGYDEVKEGDYVVLSIADSGVGIPAQDLERIFEPFYTKKVMGRSGTGLGMAVVWGTVKDHKGYIDVQSTERKGTTFDLYFPVTRREAEKDRSARSIEEYMGNGESILVVDDVQEQREIASALLTKLGYSVNAASSGEEAVEYMKSNSADLLVLDMIMDPGIDGLDTYKKIIDLHPGTKAIIASGFSETDRVKEAQRLGAGQYVKKPYTLQKVGVVVKSELER